MNYYKKEILSHENLISCNKIEEYMMSSVKCRDLEMEVKFFEDNKDSKYFFDISNLKLTKDKKYILGWQMVYICKDNQWIANKIFFVYKNCKNRIQKVTGSMVSQFNVAKIQSIDGDIYIDFNKLVLTIIITMKFKVLSCTLDRLILRINHGFRINEIKKENKNLRYRYIDETKNGIEIILDKEYKKGDIINLQLSYCGNPLLVEPCYFNNKGLLLWGEDMIFPVLNFFPRDKYSVKVTYHYGNRWNLVSCGTEQKRIIKHDQVVSTWISTEPILGLSFSLDKYENIKRELEGYTINLFYRIEDSFEIGKLVERIDNIINFYVNIMGNIPYKDINICLKEDAQICCTNSNLIFLYHVDSKIIAHEIAHMWWGMAVTGNGCGWYWFHESFAELFRELYLLNSNTYCKKLKLNKIKDTQIERQYDKEFISFFGLDEDIYTILLDYLKKFVFKIGINEFLVICRKIYNTYKYDSVTSEEILKYLHD